MFTVDLFLDVQPFTEVEVNRYGTNIDVQKLIEASGMELVVGDRAELHGFPDFRPDQVLAQRAQYVEGGYPVLAQAFVLSNRDR